MNAVVTKRTQLALSLHEQAFCEAERHKWIESQKRGCDLGDGAIHEWYRLYWRDYCRRKRLEHLRGECCFEEFGVGHFGDLTPLIDRHDPLVDRIIDMVDAGMENLDVINWALDRRIEIDRVLEVLILVDVNEARIDPGLS